MTLFFHSWEFISCANQIHNVFDEHDLAFWVFLMYYVVQHH